MPSFYPSWLSELALLRPLQRHRRQIARTALHLRGQSNLVAFDRAFTRYFHRAVGTLDLDVEGKFVALHLAIVEGQRVALRAEHRAGELLPVLLKRVSKVELVVAHAHG